MKETPNPFGSDITRIIAFLKKNKIIKTQKELALKIGCDESSLTRAKDEKMGNKNTAEKILSDIYVRFPVERQGDSIQLISTESMTAIQDAELKSPLEIYASDYCVYWKSRYGNNPIESDGILTLQKNGVCNFKSGEESFEGFAELKLPNLFITLSNENETIYIIIRVGISKKIPNYLPGVLSAVGGIDTTMPYSAIVALVKQGFKEQFLQDDYFKKEKDRLDLFFQYVGGTYSIEIDNNMMVILNSKS